MPFYRLRPEVAGGYGASTVVDVSAHPPLVSTLHYEFEGWLGDELLEFLVCFIVTERLAAQLTAAHLTGFALDSVTVTTSQEFRTIYPDRVLPRFVWMKVHGIAGIDDFGIDNNYLIVSDRAFRLMDPKHCGVQQWHRASNGQGSRLA